MFPRGDGIDMSLAPDRRRYPGEFGSSVRTAEHVFVGAFPAAIDALVAVSSSSGSSSATYHSRPGLAVKTVTRSRRASL